jgi:hypothetical protein
MKVYWETKMKCGGRRVLLPDIKARSGRESPVRAAMAFVVVRVHRCQVLSVQVAVVSMAL